VKRFLRFSPRILLTVGALAALLAVALFAVSARLSFASPNTPGSATYHGTRGHVTRVGTVTLSHLSAAAAKVGNTASTSKPRVAPLRLQPKVPGATTGVNHPPSASSSNLSGNIAYIHSFGGVDLIKNDIVTNTPLEPPDEGLASNGTLVANFVNITGDFYNTTGVQQVSPFSLNAFFGEPSTAFTSDPRVFYDHSTHTWFANMFEFSSSESHLDLAVNTGNPILDPWTIYTIDTTDPSGAGCPCLPDYDVFGIDQNNVYISSNEFSINGPQFNGAEIWAISKSQLEAGVAANFVRFGSLSIAGQAAYHVQPAISYGTPSAEYFLDSLDPNGTFDNRLGVWALTNGASVTTGSGSPVLSSTVIHSEAYGFPVNAQTPPGFNPFVDDSTTGVVDADFDAMEEVQVINGHIDGALNTSITINGETGTRDGVAWFQVTPKISGGQIASGTSVLHEGYIGVHGEYLLYPHINEALDGNMIITCSMGGSSTFLSAVYTTKLASASNFSSIHTYGAGVDPDNGFTMTPEFGGVGRWGDYSNGEVNYSNGTVWLASNYIPNNGDQFGNWGNRIVEVQL